MTVRPPPHSETSPAFFPTRLPPLSSAAGEQGVAPVWRRGLKASLNCMIRIGKPVSSTLKGILLDLDPAHSYVIFEESAGESGDSDFREILEALAHLALDIRESKAVRDAGGERLLLVLKFDPLPADQIMQEFLALDLPEGVTFYAYGSQHLN